jgi:integrase
MATVQERNGSYRILFVHHGKRETFTLGKVSRHEADNKAQQVDYVLMRLKQRLIALPPGVDIVEFVEHDGKPAPVAVDDEAPPPERITLAQLRAKYSETNDASLEPSTISGMKVHFDHLEGFFGAAFPIGDLQLADLQRYVDRRAKAKGWRKRKLAAATIQKEIVTLRTVWNWGARMNLVAGQFPYHGLRYPRTTEKPPFQTMAEIERQLKGMTEAEQLELWQSLYLLLPEIDEFLSAVKENARHRWIYPLVTFAAHAGARRSEIIRASVHDVDFADNSILIHERKRVHGRNTTRRVPMTPLLAETLTEWLKVHPGGKHLFCKGTISHSKTRREVGPLTRNEVRDHFGRTLKGTKWENIKGLHCLRHSFCSNLAMRGVDQRIIDDLVGHQTPEQQKRYRHLAPHTKAQTLKAVFG